MTPADSKNFRNGAGSNPADDASHPLKQAAFEYWQQGLYIVPLKWVKVNEGDLEVQPLIEWRDWEQKRQTLQDFEALPWHQSEGFGLVGGDRTSTDLYIGAVDFDRHNTTPEAQETGRKLLKQLLVTQIEATRRGGEHWVYYCHQQPKTLDAYRDQCALEVLGRGHLIVMAPSAGYKRLNDNMPAVIQNLESMFYDALYRVGVKKSAPQRVEEDIREAPSTPYTGEDPPCVRALLEGVEEGNRDNYAIRLACYWLNMKRNKYAATLRKLREWNKKNRPPLEDRVIEEKVKSAERGGYVYGCKDSVLAKLCRNKVNCPLAEKFLGPLELIERELESQRAVRLHPLVDFTPHTGLSLGSVLGHSSQCVIILAEKAFMVDFGFPEIREEFATHISVNPPRWAYLQPTWSEQILLLSRELLSGAQIEFPPKKEVFEKVLSGLRTYWFHSDSRWLIVVSCWKIATYFHPMFVFFPALNPQGIRESGKTTLLEVLRQSAWNPTGRESALREANLFRTIEGSRPTYLVDVTRIPPKAPEYRDVVDVIESGTEKGGEVRRIDKDTGEPVFYKTYGPKAIASRYELPFGPKVIRIITAKAVDPEYSRRRARLETDPQWKVEVGVLIRAAVKYWREVYETYQTVEQTEKLVGRHFNYWAPLLAVCRVFSPENYDSLLELAEEYAEKAERGDLLSEVEDSILITVSLEPGKTATMLLKDLTSKIQERLPWVKHWHVVKSAVDNLGIVKRRCDTAKGVSIEFDLERVKARLESRGIVLKEPPAETEPTEPAEPTKLDYGICEVCGKPGAPAKIREGRVVYLHPECEGEWEGPL